MPVWTRNQFRCILLVGTVAVVMDLAAGSELLHGDDEVVHSDVACKGAVTPFIFPGLLRLVSCGNEAAH